MLHLKALGAEVLLTRSDVGKGHPEYYQDSAARLAAETPDAFFINQFDNPANPLAHESTTGPEIWEQMGDELDAMVLGVGSARHADRPDALLPPRRAPRRIHPGRSGGLGPRRYVAPARSARPGPGLVEGIGEDFIPPIADLSGVSRGLHHHRRRELRHRAPAAARGGHPGRLLDRHPARRRAAILPRADHPKRVVTFVCDTGNKYLSKMYNDYWMRDQGFLHATASRRPARPDRPPLRRRRRGDASRPTRRC